MPSQKHDLKNLFQSAAQASEFVSAFRDTLTARNDDLRTTGHSKALHALAEAVGLDSWHNMKHILDKKVFAETLIAEYGVSEAYADAAACSLSGSQYDVDIVKIAHEYASRVPTLRRLTPDEVSETVSESTAKPVNKKQQTALSFIDDLRNASEDEPVEPYGTGLQVVVLLKLSSDSTLHLIVDPEDREVLSANIRVSGFDDAHVENVPDDLLEKLAQMYENEIEDQLLDLIQR